MISAQNPGFSAQSPGFSGSSPGQYFLRVLISISPGHVLPNTCSPVQIHAQPIFSYITLITLAFYLYLYTIWEGVLPSGWHHQIIGASHVDNGLLQASLPGFMCKNMYTKASMSGLWPRAPCHLAEQHWRWLWPNILQVTVSRGAQDVHVALHVEPKWNWIGPEMRNDWFNPYMISPFEMPLVHSLHEFPF